ncbi:hypothetical protein CBR_g41055 [Chara braunii]|uniref:Myb-like domain-containing protein n=1 Tax=Chara braunii TaxID=69332 RepID=A0A388LV63_CHABU|nr:hypothetical protein CBR_g41055 [Chara braunii]|eukprot:GBG86151.1 hypothetical protein CBR_g41055 [Chara braunii]
MASMQAREGVGAGQGGRRPPTAEPPRRYDPSLYNHLKLWEMPLPRSNEDPETEELPTLPLASGSTQLLSQTMRACGSASNKGGEFTSLLHQGLGDDDDGGLDLRLRLCSSGARKVSRTFIVDADPSPRGVQQSGSQHTEHSTLRGGVSVTGGVEPSAVGRHHGSSAPSADRLTSTCPARNGVATGSLRIGSARPSMPKRTTPTQPDLRDDGACRPAVRPAPTVENITRGVSNMRAHSDGGDDDGGGGDDDDERFREDVEAGDDDDDIPIRPLGKTGGRGRGRSRRAVRGQSVSRGGRGRVSDDGEKSATYWSPKEQMQLVRCKREQEMHLVGLGHNYGRMRTKEWKWDDIAKRMANAGKPKDADDFMKKWDNLFQNYKKIQRFQNASGRPDFFGLSNEERKEHNFKFRMERVLYNEIHAGMMGNHTIFPPNVADTGSPDGVQLPRRGAGVGESVGSEAAGEGFPEERSSTRDSDNNAASGAGGGKRKNARQQALESIADVMDRHGELMSSTIESSLDDHCRRHFCHLVSWTIFGGVVVLLSATPTSCVNHLAADHCERRSSILLAASLFAAEYCRWGCRPSVHHVLVVVFFPRRTDLLRRGGTRRRHATAARETYFSPDRRHFKRRSAKHFPLIRSHHQARLQRSPRSMSTRGNTRGKKRDIVPGDSQGQGRGRRHAPNAKRVRSEDALARVPRRGAQGWAAAAEGDYDEEFTTEEEQAEATTSAVRESGRQHSTDRSASKRMLTPPPEAQHLRARDTRTEKAVIVDLCGEDDEPLDRRRMRTRTTTTPPPAVTARTAVNERPVSGRLPATPSQPRQRNEGGDGGSVQRGGGGEVVADARAVAAEAAGAAGAGGSGTVDPVATAREEAAVVATTREEAHGEKKGDREGGEPGSSRVRREVMAKDLIDRAVLWVDDKAFWTTGEGRRLYNIVHDTREYFVAIANRLPPLAVPRSVVLPKSITRVGRIADQSQLQQAISRAAAVENVALRILHGWVFKFGNRPRGYHVAFQYSLESFATDIARAMWYGEEWCDVVSLAVCAHTIDLSMDLPLWFAGANIEDRPDDDDMAAHQESTVVCVPHAFRAAVQMGALIDGELILHDRLCRVTDCFRLLLAACMWIMRMAGDDPRSHYEAFYFVNLVAKPTLVASMHRSFDHRRPVVRAAKVVTERLRKANATFGKYSDYIPQWAPCGIGFRHDASITGPEDAKKLDWLGSGPPHDENNNNGKDDA